MQILIIDDHELFSLGLQLLLDGIKEELVVSSANTCNEAIDNFKGQSIELILLDYHLPDAGNGTALSKIKQHFPKSIVVIISSEESQSVILDAINNGAAGFIPKSSSSELLISALQLVLDGGVYLPSVVTDDQHRDHDQTSIKLTQRQWDVINLAVKGIANKVIAYELGIAEGTVKAHLFSAYKALGVRNRTEAVMIFANTSVKIS